MTVNDRTINDPEQTAASWRRWLVLLVMSIGTLVVFIDNTVVNTALPAISIDLAASIPTLQWVVDAYVLALVGLLLLGGSLGDRYGRRLWMIIGLVVFAGASIIGALSASSEQLIVARALQGIGAALVLPATLSIITNTFPRTERTKAIAIWTAVTAVGIGLGPVIGGVIVDEAGWSAVFWMHLPIIAIALLGMLVVPESRDARKIGLDVPGAVLGTAGVTALIFGIIQGNELGWTSVESIAIFATAGLLLSAFTWVQLRSEHPMLPLRFFRQKDFSGAVLTISLIVFAMIVAFFYLTQFFQIVQGRSAMEAGLLLVPASIAMMVGAPFSTLLAKRLGPRVNVLAMTLAMVVGMIMLTQLTITSDSLLPIAALFVLGFGAGLGMPALTDTIMAAVPERDAGVASAVNDVSREFGGALGIATIGSLVAGLYRANIEDLLPQGLPEQMAELLGEGIGVAAIVSEQLPRELGAAVMSASNEAFMAAMNDGFVISAAVLLSAVGIAFTLIPMRMRETQADFDEAGFEPTGDDAPGLEGAPEGAPQGVPMHEPTPELAPVPVPIRSDGR